MNVHALTLRERLGDALEKVIMGRYPGGARIVAGTDAGIGNCPHDAYLADRQALATVGLPDRDRRPGTLTPGPSPR
jgi:hypothetical protein